MLGRDFAIEGSDFITELGMDTYLNPLKEVEENFKDLLSLFPNSVDAIENAINNNKINGGIMTLMPSENYCGCLIAHVAYKNNKSYGFIKNRLKIRYGKKYNDVFLPFEVYIFHIDSSESSDKHNVLNKLSIWLNEWRKDNEKTTYIQDIEIPTPIESITSLNYDDMINNLDTIIKNMEGGNFEQIPIYSSNIDKIFSMV